MKRRDFFKTGLITVGAATLLGKITGLFQNVLAAAFPDEAVMGKQGYIRNVFKAAADKLAAIPVYKTKTADFTPICLNCKQFKTPAAGWGNCAIVGAMGTKKVCELGLCKVYMIDATKKTLKPTLDIDQTI